MANYGHNEELAEHTGYHMQRACGEYADGYQ